MGKFPIIKSFLGEETTLNIPKNILYPIILIFGISFLLLNFNFLVLIPLAILILIISYLSRKDVLFFNLLIENLSTPSKFES